MTFGTCRDRSLPIFIAFCLLIPLGVRSEPITEQLELQGAFMAKELCSGIFVNGRTQEDFLATDLKRVADISPNVVMSVDRDRRSVTALIDGTLERTAVFHLSHGCTILPRGEREVRFDTAEIKPRLPDPSRQDWPMGDLVDRGSTPSGIHQDLLNQAARLAFGNDDSGETLGTRSLLAVYKGQIILERYAPGFDRASPFKSWSMGKSVTAALVGVLVREGRLELDDPAPIAPWRAPGDPRGAITIRHLLRMSSGLNFNRVGGGEDFYTSRNHHNYVYYEAIDVFKHSYERELEFPPNTVGRYRNCDPLTLGKIIRDTVEAQNGNYYEFAQRALFDRIGARGMVLEKDTWGNMILTGHDHGTARDWARFGMLHLQDGLFQGRRILPVGWVPFVTAPAPAWKGKNYGGLFWLNAGGTYASWPRTAYWAAGAFGQRVTILPSHKLVIVRQGYTPNGRAFDENIEKVVSTIIKAVEPGPEGSQGTGARFRRR